MSTQNKILITNWCNVKRCKPSQTYRDLRSYCSLCIEMDLAPHRAHVIKVWQYSSPKIIWGMEDLQRETGSIQAVERCWRSETQAASSVSAQTSTSNVVKCYWMRWAPHACYYPLRFIGLMQPDCIKIQAGLYPTSLGIPAVWSPAHHSWVHLADLEIILQLSAHWRGAQSRKSVPLKASTENGVSCKR